MSERAAKRMNAAEFLGGVDTQPKGSFELLRGEVVAMAPERAEHGGVKARVWRALADAIARAGLPCEAFVDSLGVAVDEFTVYQPDVLVNCGEAVFGESLLAPSPVVTVEVISPSSRRLDAKAKLVDYFRVAIVRRYLVTDCARRLILHYCREGERLAVSLLREGTISLDPPGLSIGLAHIFP